MSNIIKIYQETLAEGKCEAFQFHVKAYKKLKGIILCGQAELSFVLNKNNLLLLHSYDATSDKDSPPNRRALELDKDISAEHISGNIIKKTSTGKVSLYLLLQ